MLQETGVFLSIQSLLTVLSLRTKDAGKEIHAGVPMVRNSSF